MEHHAREPTQREIPPCGCIEPGLADPATCYCGVEDLMRVIRRRYSLAVLNAVHTRGGARFHDIESVLPEASTSTIADTLRALTVARLLDRTELPDALPRTFYAITPSGIELISRLRQLLEDIRPE